MESLKELLFQLNSTDECSKIEAKRASEIGKSIMETVCAFANEPNLGGGYILLGVEKEDNSMSLFPEYTVTGIPTEDLDKHQSDLASFCAQVFNKPIRPHISVESINDKNAIVVFVEELPEEQKPLYIQKLGLPAGAYRRIGPTDSKGTEDDMAVYYTNPESFDSSIVKDAEQDDLSTDNIELYRKFRSAVNSSAEELTYSDEDLLLAINAVKKKKGEISVTYTGLLTFGSKMALRRILPMVRVDYIRVSTNDWVEDPNNRFTSTLDMRGSLLELVQRIIHTISDDLPKGFELTDDNIQAKNMGLPLRVLREAVVNALIHRSYRENSPIQIIRYPNRIEISNPGFSLKTEEQLGEPGSINRNPFIAAIFHETNLAETKGSGIRIMRALMNEHAMMPPTFESDRENNKFTVRLLLHHLLNEEDLKWLKHFEHLELTDNQKRILVFLREVGAVDNSVARQINGSESSFANGDLRRMRQLKLIEQKGRSRYTYYIPSEVVKATLSMGQEEFGEGVNALSVDLSALPPGLSALPTKFSALPTKFSTLPTKLESLGTKLRSFNEEQIEDFVQITKLISNLPKRINDKNVLEKLIEDLCAIERFRLNEIAYIIGKNEKYLHEEFIKPMLVKKKIIYNYPDMINHPDQSYLTDKK